MYLPRWSALMGKRLVQNRRGGLAVIDAEPSRDDWGDASGIGSYVESMHPACQLWAACESISRVLAVPSYREVADRHLETMRHGEDDSAVPTTDDHEAAVRGGAVLYITMLSDVRDAPGFRRGDVTRTSLFAAEVQVASGVARYSEGWEVVAAALDRPLPVFGDRLATAHRLKGAAWLN